jgi:hypothetical protein
MKIQAITSWQNGEELQGREFNLIVINDNLSTSATFYYTIFTEEISHMETVIVTPEIPAYDEVVDGETIHHDEVPAVTTEVLVVDTPSVMLVNGNITMDGIDYQTWDSSVSANEWAYNWAATKLNLVIIPDQVFA